MNIFFCVICAALLVLGMTELVRAVSFRQTKSLTEGPFVLVVTPNGADDCECALRAAMERIRWLDMKGPCRLICVNESGDPEIDSICRLLALRYPCLRVCKKGEVEYNIGA